MKKENLLLIAEGHKLIALAYAREAGMEVVMDAPLAPEATEAIQTKSTQEETVETKKPTIRPKAPQAPVEEPQVDEDDHAEDGNAEEGYSLDELNGMTVKQLKELASENGITIPKDTKKADIIDMIMEGAEEADEDAEDADEPVSEDEDVQADEQDEQDEADEELVELTIADVVAMELADLKELAKEYEVDLPKNVSHEDAVSEIVTALFDEDEIEAYQAEIDGNEEEAQEEDGDEEDYVTPEEIEEMSLAELKVLASAYEIEYPKLVKADKLREIVLEALFAEEDGDDDSTDLDQSDLAEEYGLNDMSVEELTDLLVEHEIKAKGNKQALIAKVLEAIESGVIEVEGE